MSVADFFHWLSPQTKFTDVHLDEYIKNNFIPLRRAVRVRVRVKVGVRLWLGLELGLG